MRVRKILVLYIWACAGQSNEEVHFLFSRYQIRPDPRPKKLLFINRRHSRSNSVSGGNRWVSAPLLATPHQGRALPFPPFTPPCPTHQSCHWSLLLPWRWSLRSSPAKDLSFADFHVLRDVFQYLLCPWVCSHRKMWKRRFYTLPSEFSLKRGCSYASTKQMRAEGLLPSSLVPLPEPLFAPNC